MIVIATVFLVPLAVGAVELRQGATIQGQWYELCRGQINYFRTFSLHVVSVTGSIARVQYSYGASPSNPKLTAGSDYYDCSVTEDSAGKILEFITVKSKSKVRFLFKPDGSVEGSWNSANLSMKAEIK